MNTSAIYHVSTDNFCYALDDDNLIISLQTGKEIDEVYLCYGDPYTNGIMGGNYTWNYDTTKILYKSELKEKLMWSICIQPPFKRCSYFFKLISGDEILYYLEDGIHESPTPLPNGRAQYFIFPWMQPADINRTPEWVKDTVWYQIFPERFCNGDHSLNPHFTKAWKGPDEPVDYMDFYGGDIPGIISKLEYLKELGISGIYLNPVFCSRSNHKYDVYDYLTIDPHFGTNAQMRELVDKAHSLGIKVIIDGVFNHSSTKFPIWKDVCKKGPESKYYDWYMINKWPFDHNFLKNNNATNGNYYTFAFFDMMPKLNTSNPKVIKYFTQVCMKWIKEFDIDGIRFDVSNEISHEFFKILRKNTKKLKPDFFLLGEQWNNSMPWLRGDEIDSVMNYPLKDSIGEFWLNENSDKTMFEYAINRCYNLYMQQTNSVLFNLLDSHDTVRLASVLNNKDKFYQQLAVLFTMPGSPCIYYGTEVMLKGQHDPDCRRCMPWTEIEQGKYTKEIDYMKSLIGIHNNYTAARSNSYSFTNNYNNNRVIEYVKHDIPIADTYNVSLVGSRNTIQVVLNCSKEPIECNNIKEVLFSNGLNGTTLAPDGTLIYLL